MKRFNFSLSGCAGAVMALALTLALILPMRSDADWSEFGDYQIAWGLGAGEVNAADMPADTTNFDGNLSALDDDVQTALETVDDIDLLESPLTTKGDLWGFSTTDDRLPAGSNNQVLHVDNTTAPGLAWKAILALIVGISDAGGYFTSTNVEGALQELGTDVAALHPFEQHYTLAREWYLGSSETSHIKVNVKGVAHSTYGGAYSFNIQQGTVYDFANHKLTYDYTLLQPVIKVTVLASDPEWIGTWDNSSQTAFWQGFGKVANTVTVTARIRRYGSTAADAYHRIYLVLSDETGAHSTSTSQLISDVGTTWEDMTLSAVDVSSYNGELEWAFEIVTDADNPPDSINATSTLHVHRITVSQY